MKRNREFIGRITRKVSRSILIAFIVLSGLKLSAQNPVIGFSNHDQFSDEAKVNLVEVTNLSQNPYLSMNFTMEKPLLAHLRDISPTSSDEYLLGNGNFHFIFYVDDEEVFIHSLNPGAGSAQSKKEKLAYSIPLMYPGHVDHWGWYTWLRFMKMHGGQDALDVGEHKLSVKVCCYLYANYEYQTVCYIAEGDVTVNIEEREYDKALAKYQEIEPTEDWQLSEDKLDKTLIENLNKKILQNRFEHITSIAVIKDGELLMEEYFNGMSRDSLHDTRSVGKSFASTMLGVAIQDGYIKSEELAISEFYDLRKFDNYSKTKEAIKLRDLLTMSSSFVGNDEDFNSPGNEENMYPTSDWVKFALDLPTKATRKPDYNFEYFTAGVVVLGDIIHQKVPNGLVVYAEEKLFQPLGEDKYRWELTPQNVGNTAGGLQMTTLGYAKYGQLYKNKGLWNGKQVISADWVEKSLDRHEKIPGRTNENYGYLFWNKTYKVNGQEYEVSYCSGNGGNCIFIFKDIPYVIVVTAQAYNLPYGHIQVDDMMERYILPAVLD